jgi:hypothetical protein
MVSAKKLSAGVGELTLLKLVVAAAVDSAAVTALADASSCCRLRALIADGTENSGVEPWDGPSSSCDSLPAGVYAGKASMLTLPLSR